MQLGGLETQVNRQLLKELPFPPFSHGEFVGEIGFYKAKILDLGLGVT